MAPLSSYEAVVVVWLPEELVTYRAALSEQQSTLSVCCTYALYAL